MLFFIKGDVAFPSMAGGENLRFPFLRMMTTLLFSDGVREVHQATVFGVTQQGCIGKDGCFY